MMRIRTFPILRSDNSGTQVSHIPWHVAEAAYEVYAAKYGTAQSIERIAARGGFSTQEMDQYLPDWREKANV